MWARFSASWGYLNKQGYCTGSNVLGSPSGDCHLFPVIIGETGTGFTASPPAPPLPLTWLGMHACLLPACFQPLGNCLFQENAIAHVRYMTHSSQRHIGLLYQEVKIILLPGPRNLVIAWSLKWLVQEGLET